MSDENTPNQEYSGTDRRKNREVLPRVGGNVANFEILTATATPMSASWRKRSTITKWPTAADSSRMKKFSMW